MLRSIIAAARGQNVFCLEVTDNLGADESLLESRAASFGLGTAVIYLNCTLLLVPFDIFFLIWWIEKLAA
jgi:hypothetical protein